MFIVGLIIGFILSCVLLSIVSGNYDNEEQLRQDLFLEKQKFRWVNVKNEKPLAVEVGNWDGKRSSKILVVQNNNFDLVSVAYMYSGFLEGTNFCDFYDANSGIELVNVTHWTEITDKF